MAAVVVRAKTMNDYRGGRRLAREEEVRDL